MTDLLDALRTVALLDLAGDDELRALLEGSEELRLAPGELVAREGDEQAWFHALLDGAVEWTRRLGARPVRVLEHGPGSYFGHEPILLAIPVPVTGTVLRPAHLVRFDGVAFWRLLSSNPAVRRELLTTVSQRVQTLETVSAQTSRLAALGTLSAGLAHELNNPAAAVRRGAAELADGVRALAAAGLALAGAEPALEGLLTTAAATLAGPPPAVRLSALDLADAEDELADWLDDSGVPDPALAAPTLLRAGLDPARLDRVAALGPPGAALRWVLAALADLELVAEVAEGARRISDLVEAMRDYTYLDQAPVQQVDVHAGLESTLTVLGHQLRAGVEVVRDYDPDLPAIEARGSELNQVWTNLIANAADAVADRPAGGRITLRTRGEGDRVRVEVADDGPGIPADVRDRIFDPYFTTKGVGRGTGLGLDLARRVVVEGHGGDLSVSSSPGDTRFTVRLPLHLPLHLRAAEP